MKLILHHFWKDVRSLRWLLGLWLLVVLTQAVITVLAVQPSYQVARVAEMIAPSAIWYFVNGITWTVVIVYLIQSEPVTGASSFWLTRPIPPLISILSKLIFIFGLIIVPSLIPRTTDLLVFGVPSHDVCDTTQWIIYFELMLVLCVVWLATYQLDTTKPFTWSATQIFDESEQSAKVPLIAPPAGGGGVPFIRAIESSFQPKDGKEISLQSDFEGYGTTDQLDWLSQLQQDNPGLMIEGGAVPANEPVPAFRVTSDLTGKLKDQTGTPNLKITGDVLSLQKRAEIPLTGAGFARIPSALIRLIAVQSDKSGIDLSVEEVGYQDMVNAVEWTEFPTVYLLVDPKNRIGIILRKSSEPTLPTVNSAGTLNRLSALLTLEARTDDLPDNIRANFEAEGANGLVLYVYEATPKGAFESDVKVPNYTFHPGDR